METVVTFIFVSVILSLKYDNLTKSHAEAGLTIGATLFGMITVAASRTGGCLNPAVGLIQTIYQYVMA